jgi:putative ABC transport system substrate-binding protein
VDIIVTIGTDATVAARDATAAIPIVMLSAADPVGTGLVESLARPGRNVTGTSMVGPDIEAKRLALLREVVPSAHRVGVLVDPTTAVSGYSRSESEATYQTLGLEPIFVEVSAREKLDEALAEMARRRVQAVMVHRSVLFSLNAQTIMDTALARSLPVFVEDRGMLEAGGLMSYTIDDLDQLKHFATFVDRILRGAKPADLPVEQPTRFVLAVNLKTAKALGLTIPQSVLLRANDVIR